MAEEEGLDEVDFSVIQIIRTTTALKETLIDGDITINITIDRGEPINRRMVEIKSHKTKTKEMILISTNHVGFLWNIEQ